MPEDHIVRCAPTSAIDGLLDCRADLESGLPSRWLTALFSSLHARLHGNRFFLPPRPPPLSFDIVTMNLIEPRW